MVIARDHHACREQVLNALRQHSAVRETVRTAFCHVKRNLVMVTVSKHIVCKVAPACDVLIGEVVITQDTACSADAGGRRGPGDIRSLTARNIFAQQFNGFGLTAAQQDLSITHRVTVGRADRQVVVEFHKHEIFFVGGCDGERHADLRAFLSELFRQEIHAAVHADDSIRFAVPQTACIIGTRTQRVEVFRVFVHINTGDAHRRGNANVIRLGIRRACRRAKVAVTGRIHKTAGTHRRNAGMVGDGNRVNCSIFHNRSGHKGVHVGCYTGFLHHFMRDPFVNFGVDRRTNRIQLITGFQLAMPGTTARRGHSVHQFRRNTPHQLDLFTAEFFPVVKEGVKRRPAFDDRSAQVAF